MKALILTAAVGIMSAVGGCQSTANTTAYANPLDACASIQDEDDRARCVQNVVADVAMSTKREKDRKRAP